MMEPQKAIKNSDLDDGNRKMGARNGRLYWTRTSDLSHVKGTRYQLR